jgi:hypothetical protein
VNAPDPKLAALAEAIENFSKAQFALIHCAIKVADAYAATLPRTTEEPKKESPTNATHT